MIKFFDNVKYSLLLISLCGLLTGCLGGSIAQQIARSIATSVADNAVANAMDVQEISVQDKKDRKSQNIVLKDTTPDPYTIAFVNARFEQIKPIAEPLPEQLTESETPIAVAVSSKLVRVELFNLLIGDEKAAIYAKAQLIGAASLPKQREWKLWQVGTGVVILESAHTNKNQVVKKSAQSAQLITFLIPPEFGKLPSGSMALVEIASPGELNIARYKMN